MVWITYVIRILLVARMNGPPKLDNIHLVTVLTFYGWKCTRVVVSFKLCMFTAAWFSQQFDCLHLLVKSLKACSFIQADSVKHWLFITGHGWLLTFAKAIQRECDRQARRIIEEFKNTRKFSSVINNIQDSLTQKSSITTDKWVTVLVNIGGTKLHSLLNTFTRPPSSINYAEASRLFMIFCQTNWEHSVWLFCRAKNTYAMVVFASFCKNSPYIKKIRQSISNTINYSDMIRRI